MNKPNPLPVIRRLSENTVNRIAAGEVIERPAAALKEIVENAIDAGASRIAISLISGGIDRIDVTDNGCGMSPDQLLLAVERHCTSKLADETLVKISTLGFRGEALPSIGAAARLSIISRTAADDNAWRIRVEGGQVFAPEPHAGSPGTRVIVEDLFFATPARRKFLKSPRVEAGHAEAVVRRLAMAVPQTSFSLKLDDRVVFDLPVQDLIERAASILATGDSEAFIPVQGERQDLKLSGYVCGPAVTRPTTSGQILMVNSRPVTDPVLRTAVRVAYRQLIEYGRHPIVALHLTLPAEQVDVNVHPAKTEMRFSDEAAVRSLVIGSIGRALGGGAGTGGVRPVFQARTSGRTGIYYPPESATASDIPPRVADASSNGQPTGFAEQRLALGDRPSVRALTTSTHPTLSDQKETFANPSDQPVPVDIAQESMAHPLGAPVAQVLDTYIIALADDGTLVLVDQHAAHERLTHEALRAQYLAGEVRAQRLLLPAVIDLGHGQATLLCEQAGLLEKMGIELEAFGPGAVLVRAMPALLGQADPEPLLRDLADELEAEDTTAIMEAAALDRRLDAVIARMACHGSIRAGRRLTSEEMAALLRQMEQTPRAGTCSHGRPTWLKLTRAEIERLFGRR